MPPRQRPAHSRLYWLALAAIASTFLFLAGRSLDLPAPYYCELEDTIYGLELALGLPPSPTDWSLPLRGHRIPLRGSHPYDWDALQIFWSALALKLGGATLRSLRWASLGLSAGLLILLFGVARRLFSPGVALAAAALLAVDPAFFIWSRMGFATMELTAAFFALAACLAAARWVERRSPRALCAAGFLLGFELNVALKAVAFVIALPAVCVAVVPRRLWPTRRQATAALACFALGGLNTLAYNVVNGFPTVVVLWERLLAPTPQRADNMNVLGNLRLRFLQLVDMLSGEIPTRTAGGLAPNHLAPWIVLSCTAGLAVSCAWPRRPSDETRALRGLLALQGLLFAMTLFTPGVLAPPHLLVLWPGFALISAVAAARLWRSSRPGRVLAAALLASLALSSIKVDLDYGRTLRTTGGAGLQSDAMYRLVAYLEEHHIERPLCLGWGSRVNIYFLTKGRIRPRDAHRFSLGINSRLLRVYEDALRDPSNRYILLADSVRPNLEREYGYDVAFRAVARKMGKRLALEREFRDREGAPIFLLYRAQ